MTVSKTPPGRASTVIWSSGALTPAGPQKWARCLGSVMQRKTSSLGASKTRVKTSSPTSGRCSLIGLPLLIAGGRALDLPQVLVELVEPLGPGPAVLLDPARDRVEPRPLQVAGPELGVPAARDETAALEHLQVLGDGRQGHVERRGQL